MDILASSTTQAASCCNSTSAPAWPSGADPVAWINANPGRIKSMHCKDWKAGEKGYAVLFGEGDVAVEGHLRGGGDDRRHRVLPDRAGSRARRGQLARAEQCLANWKKLRA